MESTSRAIILKKDDKGKYFISIKRTKYNGDSEYVYYTFPGGHVEENETFEETLIREVKEELGIEILIVSEFESIFNEDLNRDEKFYLCEHKSGIIGTGNGPEWTNVNIEKYGKYEIERIYIDEIKYYNILPKEIASKLEKSIDK